MKHLARTFVFSMLTILALVLLILAACTASAQYTNQGPTNSPAQNSTVYVGAVPGYYPSIQSAVTFACAASAHRTVSIPAGYSGTDTIAAVTGGCTAAYIWDDRAVLRACYSWSGTTYTNASCSGGGGVTPTVQSQVVVGNGTGYTLRQLTPADIAPAFSASFSCAQCGTYETGYTGITSVNGTISYANPSTPTSASVSDGTNSTTLTTPFNVWTLAHTYTTNTTFTLTAVGNSQTVQQQQGIAFTARTFSGAGSGGATGATASGSNAALAGATGTLASAGLGNQGTYACTAAGQYCYVLMQGGSHTFTSGGFSVPMNAAIALTFTNQYGAQIAMFLYQTANSLGSSGSPVSFPLVVASFLLFPFARRRRRAGVFAALALLASSAGAQVTLGGHVQVPSTSDSTLGQSTVAMTDADCNITAPSGCTVSNGPYVGTLTVTGTLSTIRHLYVVGSPGRQYTVLNNTTGTLDVGVVGATGSSLVVFPSGSVGTVVSPDGVSYKGVGSSVSSGVSSVNSLTGNVTLAAGANTTVTASGNTLTIASTGGGGGGVSTSANVYAANGQVQVDSLVTSNAYGLQCFGTSYMAAGGATSFATGQCLVLGADIGATTTNNAVSGENGEDLAYRVFSVLNPGDSQNPIVIADEGGNNVPSSTAGLPDYLKVTYATNTWVAMSKTNKIFANNAAVAATGTTAADTTFPYAPGLTCSSGTCTFTYSAYVGTPGAFVVWYKMLSTGGTLSATVDGAACTDYVSGSATVSTAWQVPPLDTPATVGAMLCSASNATHSLVVTANAASAPVTFLGFGFPPVTRYRGTSSPRMFVGGTALKPGNSVPDTTAYNQATIAAALKTIAIGLYTPIVDLNSLYDQNLDFSATAVQNCPGTTEGQHPTDCGHRLAADLWESVINAPGPAALPSVLPSPLKVAYPAAVTSSTQDSYIASSSYTDSLYPMLNLAPSNANEAGVGTTDDSNIGYGVGLINTNLSANGNIGFAWCPPNRTSNSQCNMTVYASWGGPNASTAVFHAPAISAGSLAGNSLTVGSGGASIQGGLSINSTGSASPLYLYSTAQGIVPDQGNTVDFFTAVTGGFAFGYGGQGAMNDWMLLNSSGLAVSVPLTVGNATATQIVSGNVNTQNLTLTTAGTATASINYGSEGGFFAAGSAWNGSAAVSDTWKVATVMGAGTNPTSTLDFTHTGTSGASAVRVPNMTVTGSLTVAGSSVCLSNGTNCPSATAPYTMFVQGRPTLSSCLGGSLTGTSTNNAFHVSGITGTGCTVTFSTPIQAGVCTAGAYGGGTGLPPAVTSTTTSVSFGLTSGTTDLNAICF